MFFSIMNYKHTVYIPIRCWSPNVTRSVVMVSWFTRNYCACAPMLYISELCEDCAVANEIDYEIDYAWASIHDNGHVITACDVWLQQRIDCFSLLSEQRVTRKLSDISLCRSFMAWRTCMNYNLAKNQLNLPLNIFSLWTWQRIIVSIY